MTVPRARKLLGKLSNEMTDEQIIALIKQVKSFADVCVENINNKINKEGTNFLYMESKR